MADTVLQSTSVHQSHFNWAFPLATAESPILYINCLPPNEDPVHRKSRVSKLILLFYLFMPCNLFLLSPVASKSGRNKGFMTVIALGIGIQESRLRLRESFRFDGVLDSSCFDQQFGLPFLILISSPSRKSPPQTPPPPISSSHTFHSASFLPPLQTVAVQLGVPVLPRQRVASFALIASSQRRPRASQITRLQADTFFLFIHALESFFPRCF
ncbi:hypothetical protein CEXT_335351 [Caerostris extrusa]|uniref:Uncharacterized protein n=1 Tax=Caerostris extrusa TaxID=172846 RepID=A0AAV4NME6_CAEEX|nr:hypothetical protein CEXT_335351 [Caerostris extrusa]